jgi:hypothetical protein
MSIAAGNEAYENTGSKNGRLMDPDTGLDAVGDVAIGWLAVVSL